MPQSNEPQCTIKPILVENAIKRVIDVLGAILGLVIFLPIFPILALAIKITSPGPILYRAERTGRFGRPFRILKFRTMRVGSDAASGTTAKDDSRITRIGHFLRKYKLDETPQFFNILAGDMSLVGPRPELPKYTAMYSDEERSILSVRPGLTDFASLEYISMSEEIVGEDPELIFQQKIMRNKNRLRVKYVNERSLLVDMKIIARTVLKILRK